MKAGRLRHVIHLEKKLQIRDKFNAELEQWQSDRRLWGEIVTGSTKEFLSAQQINNTLSHEVFIRYLPEIHTDMRIRYEGRIFNIHGIKDFGGLKRTMCLTCEEFFGK